MEDVVLVAAVREDVRSRVLRVDGAKVTRILEAALAGKLPRNEGDSASHANPEGGAAKQGSSSTTAVPPVGAKGEDGTQNSGGKYFVSSGLVGLRRKQKISDFGENDSHRGKARV